MKQKVVQGGMDFKDDIQIVDTELTSPGEFIVGLLPMLQRDELQVFKAGRVYVATHTPTSDPQLKVYTCAFGLEAQSPKKLEDEFIAQYTSWIVKKKAEFIRRVMTGVTVPADNTLKGTLKPAVSATLVEKIIAAYAPPSKTSVDGSALNHDPVTYENLLLVDWKAYTLLTIPQYIEGFKKSFEPKFYEELQKQCGTMTPEAVAALLGANKDKVHRKALPHIRNKIWHPYRSFELLMGGTYYVPYYRGPSRDLEFEYKRLLEMRIKIDAAKEAV